MHGLTIGMPKEWLEILERKARERGVSKGELIRRQLKPLLEKPKNPHEDKPTENPEVDEESD